VSEVRNNINADDMADELHTLFTAAADGLLDDCDCFDDLHGCRVKTFADTTILTSDAGIVLTLAGGEEFQITIVRTK
jgi:hypothetical protein